jgi:DNA-binding MarR family transcriptional regulator
MQDPILRLDAFLPYRLSITSNLVSDVIADCYKAMFGLKVPEWRLLAVMAEAGGMNQQEIGLRTRMDKVTVSRAAVALHMRGLIQRQPNPEDGRSHLLTLNAAGRALYEKVVPQALALEQAIFAALPDEEASKFNQSLDRIQAAALALLGTRNVFDDGE